MEERAKRRRGQILRKSNQLLTRTRKEIDQNPKTGRKRNSAARPDPGQEAGKGVQMTGLVESEAGLGQGRQLRVAESVSGQCQQGGISADTLHVTTRITESHTANDPTPGLQDQSRLDHVLQQLGVVVLCPDQHLITGTMASYLRIMLGRSLCTHQAIRSWSRLTLTKKQKGQRKRQQWPK